MNNIDHMIDLFHKSLVPGDSCNTRVLFKEMDLGIVKQNPWYKSELREHSGKDNVMCIDHSSKIQLLDLCENSHITHPHFIPGTDYFVRTIFFKDNKKSVRLYCNKYWRSNRKTINLIDFIKQVHKQDGVAIQLFEKVLFGVI